MSVGPGKAQGSVKGTDQGTAHCRIRRCCALMLVLVSFSITATEPVFARRANTYADSSSASVRTSVAESTSSTGNEASSTAKKQSVSGKRVAHAKKHADPEVKEENLSVLDVFAAVPLSASEPKGKGVTKPVDRAVVATVRSSTKAVSDKK